MTTVEEAQELIEKTGERFSEAEVYRMRGALMLMREPVDEAAAEASFRQALEVARRHVRQRAGDEATRDNRCLAQPHHAHAGHVLPPGCVAHLSPKPLVEVHQTTIAYRENHCRHQPGGQQPGSKTN